MAVAPAFGRAELALVGERSALPWVVPLSGAARNQDADERPQTAPDPQYIVAGTGTPLAISSRSRAGRSRLLRGISRELASHN